MEKLTCLHKNTFGCTETYWQIYVVPRNIIKCCKKFCVCAENIGWLAHIFWLPTILGMLWCHDYVIDLLLAVSSEFEINWHVCVVIYKVIHAVTQGRRRGWVCDSVCRSSSRDWKKRPKLDWTQPQKTRPPVAVAQILNFFGCQLQFLLKNRKTEKNRVFES